MKISGTVITDYLILEASNKLRNLFALTNRELISRAYPRIVTRKDPSLDNYFAELLMRSAYVPSAGSPDFEEIVVRGSDEDLPTKLNPQIKGAVLIGIGGKSHNKDFIAAYDEHSDAGTRSVDSASQVVCVPPLASGKVGGVSGFVHAIANLAGIIAPAATGYLVQWTGTFVSAFALAGGFAVVGALLVALLVKPLGNRLC